MGFAGVLGKYYGYNDNAATYDMFYWSTWTDFGGQLQTINKILKKLKATIIGGASYTIVYRWMFDYIGNSYSTSADVPIDINAAEYNIAEYNNAEYSGDVVYSSNNVNLSGAGKVLRFGFSVTINGASLSFQKMDVFAKTGKVL